MVGEDAERSISMLSSSDTFSFGADNSSARAFNLSTSTVVICDCPSEDTFETVKSTTVRYLRMNDSSRPSDVLRGDDIIFPRLAMALNISASACSRIYPTVSHDSGKVGTS